MSDALIEQDCPSCHGEGTTGTAKLTCWKCQGSGVVRVKPDHARPMLDEEPKTPRRLGRPVGSKNKPKEIVVSEPVESKPQPSITWWTPIVRSGGADPIVRITNDGKISLTLAVFRLLGIDPKDVNRFRMGASADNALVIQFAPAGSTSADTYPWRLNRDRSVWTRPIEHLQQIQMAAGRYRVKIDAERRLVIVSPANRMADSGERLKAVAA